MNDKVLEKNFKKYVFGFTMFQIKDILHDIDYIIDSWWSEYDWDSLKELMENIVELFDKNE